LCVILTKMFLETLIEPVAHHQKNSVHDRASRQSERAKRSAPARTRKGKRRNRLKQLSGGMEMEQLYVL